MNYWALYPAVLGTFLSIILWGLFVSREHTVGRPVTLSELGVERNVKYFRLILWICGPLFGLTAIFYIIPQLHSAVVSALLLGIIFLELFAGVFLPVNSRGRTLHNIVAYTMGLVMFLGGIGFALVLPRFNLLELAFVFAMFVCSIGMAVHRRHYIFYELIFIFLSHFTIVTAALAFAR